MKFTIGLTLLLLTLLLTDCSQPDPLLSQVDNSPDSTIEAMTVYKGELYVGGCFESVGHIKSKYIARWNGAQWASVGNGLEQGWYGVTALCVYKDELYAAGDFEMINDTTEVEHIAKWNGAEWLPVGSGKPQGTHPYISALCVYDDELYAACLFDTLGGIGAKNIARWNGDKWNSVGKGVSYTIITLAVFKNELYAGGICNWEDGNSVKWDGRQWNYLSPSTTDFTEVQSYAEYRGNLLIGGTFGRYTGGSGGRTGFNPFNHIASYNGKSYSVFKEGIDDNEASIVTMAEYNGDLFVGGLFAFPKGHKINNIIKWNGKEWQIISTGTRAVNCLANYEGNLYAGGSFQDLNGQPIRFFAKLNMQDKTQ